MNSPQQPVETALKHDVTTKGEVAPRGQFDELKNSAIESGHCAMGRDQIEIGLEQIEQVEGAEREASGRDPHEQECEPGRPVEQPVEQLQKRHRLPLFPALDDNRPLLTLAWWQTKPSEPAIGRLIAKCLESPGVIEELAA
jgi:hypothetical protein